MPAIKGPRKVRRYGDEFKARAVNLSLLPGVQVKDVAEALDIHPFMLSRWRKEYREGKIKAAGKIESEATMASELKRLRILEREHARLKEEHALLKKAIRFCSERKGRSSPSSTDTGTNTG
jgi:transposase